jgi:Heparinase II/III-like protein/Heparinase II/III N-terminus
MLARFARMSVGEIGWRGRAAARIAWDRIRAAHTAPAWDRRELAGALAADQRLDEARGLLRQGQWLLAHRRLAEHFASRPQRFPLAPSNRTSIVATIRDRYPDAPTDARARADRIVAGRYDLLGYRGLAFDAAGGATAAVDWTHDPVHGRRPPRRFWSRVPYLDPACGDHKIIWELNRHQHWLALGRAYWLTGDPRYRDRCVVELRSWLDANPPLTGINWASMLELGLRSLSWLWMLAFFAGDGERDESPWIVDLLLAIDRQLTQIERNLSYYFSPNTHLLGEALALYVAGRSLPELGQSPRREALGRRVLLGEIGRQIAPDGGHRELSTHYQRYTLDFYLLALIVARVTQDAAAGDFEPTVARLAGATRLLADDHGRLPHLGDDDGGALFPMAGRAPDDVRDSLAAAAALLGRPDLEIEPAPEETCWLLAHPGLAPCLSPPTRPVARARRSGALTDTGYYVSRSARGDHLVVDGGPHGYLNGGHAHADALSVSLAVAGVPLLVDPGTGSYTVDAALRDRLRSSQLHNTLVIDGRSQSTARGPFAWSHTANSRVRRWRTHDAFDYFEGEHDGYAPLQHRRHILMVLGDLLVVADLLRGPGHHTAAVHWHVDPRWTVTARGRVVSFARAGACCQFVVPNGQVERFVADRETGLGWHAPVYGRVKPLTSLRVTCRGNWPLWIAGVFGLHADNPIVDAEFVPVAAAAGSFEHAVALRIVRRHSTDVVALAEAAAGDERAAWRFDAFETDARLLFGRLVGDRLTRFALMDGSFMRKQSEPGSRFEMPHRLPEMHVDLQDAVLPAGVTMS